jgi:hypothetical protein
VGLIHTLVVCLLGGCVGGGVGLDLPWLDVVYECHVEAADLELCFDSGPDALEAELVIAYRGPAACVPTERHLGPCRYHCDGGSGCNALNGCFCP